MRENNARDVNDINFGCLVGYRRAALMGPTGSVLGVQTVLVKKGICVPIYLSLRPHFGVRNSRSKNYRITSWSHRPDSPSILARCFESILQRLLQSLLLVHKLRLDHLCDSLIGQTSRTLVALVGTAVYLFAGTIIEFQSVHFLVQSFTCFPLCLHVRVLIDLLYVCSSALQIRNNVKQRTKEQTAGRWGLVSIRTVICFKPTHV